MAHRESQGNIKNPVPNIRDPVPSKLRLIVMVHGDAKGNFRDTFFCVSHPFWAPTILKIRLQISASFK